MSLKIILTNGKEYVNINDIFFVEMHLIEKVVATNEDLTDILYAFTHNGQCTIPIYKNGYPKTSYPKTTWYGDIAKTIVHNLKYS
jgi:hypothetical protein